MNRLSPLAALALLFHLFDRSARSVRLAALVTCILAVPACPAARAQQVTPEDATVLIRTSNTLRHGRGSGFVIGDGSWVVTASHVVSADLGKGRRASDQTVLVYSPWTGRPYEARVAAVDGAADLAILRLPQPGLPALPLEGLEVTDPDAALAALKDRPLHLYGFPLTYGDATVAALAKPEVNRSKLFQVLKHRQTNVSLCVLHECPDAQPGWSGGPIVSGDRGTVVAIFHSLYRRDPQKEEGLPAGSLAGYLAPLLRAAGAADPGTFLRPSAATIPKPADAGERMARQLRSISWSAERNWKKAEEEQRAIVKMAPEDALAHLELGLLLLGQKRDEEAVTSLKEAVRLAPRSLLANLYLGRALHYNYEPQAAIQALKTALEISPGEVEPQLVLAEVYDALKKPDQAEAVLRAAMTASPDHPSIMSQLGGLLLRTARGTEQEAREKEGLALLGKAADLSEADASLVFIQMNYARALEAAGKLQQAESRYRQVLRLDPGYAQAYYFLAQLFLKQNRIEDAQIQLEAGIVLPNLSEENVRAFRALQFRINQKAK